MKSRGCTRLRLDSLTHESNAGHRRRVPSRDSWAIGQAVRQVGRQSPGPSGDPAEKPGPREVPSEQPHTWLVNALCSAAFLGRKAAHRACDARSTFERPPAGVGDSDAGDRDLLPAYSHCLVMRRGKAVFDQVSYHIDVEPMGEQSCPGAAAQPCIGKHFERPPLFCAKVNPRQTKPPASEFSGRSYMPPYDVCQSGLPADREQCCRPAERHASRLELWRSAVT